MWTGIGWQCNDRSLRIAAKRHFVLVGIDDRVHLHLHPVLDRFECGATRDRFRYDLIRSRSGHPTLLWIVGVGPLAKLAIASQERIEKFVKVGVATAGWRVAVVRRRDRKSTDHGHL